MKPNILCFAILISSAVLSAQQPSQSWNPDKGTHYVNPILNADYSDPDVICKGFKE